MKSLSDPRPHVGLAALIVIAAAGGCDNDAAPDAGTPAPPGTRAPAPRSAPAPAPPSAPVVKYMSLLRLTLTSGVKDREPVDKLDAAIAGERLYAHLAVRNRTGKPRRVRIEFEVNGKARTTLTLDVGEAWQWRTWGYNTLRDDDTGEIMVTVTEVDGPELAQVSVPIRRKAR